MTTDNDVPQSVEEAGALLGAAITRCLAPSSSAETITPPKGMHSSFATTAPVPLSDLFLQLSFLRSQLRSASRQEPLVASPSLLAVLMKLLSVSSTKSKTTGPMLLSTPLRSLWVDCVVDCLVLGDGLTGKTRNDLFKFVQRMMALAGTNPKSQKAAGGTRISAMAVIGGLFQSDLSVKLTPWALNVLQLSHRGLKSSGNGEPSYRIESVRTACAVLVACRRQALTKNPSAKFVLKSALEDKAIVETVRMLRQAASDKFPEVRQAAANLASLVAPMLITSNISQKSSKPNDAGSSGGPTASLEDVLVMSLKNVDDERAGVSAAWSEALGRCLCTSIEYGEKQRSSERSDHSNTKSAGIAMTCCTLPAAIKFLVHHFCKVGGELAASRGGGSFSMGGRAVRIGVSLALVKLIALQCKVGDTIGPSQSMSLQQVISATLQMVGPELQKQLLKKQTESSSSPMEHLDATAHDFGTEKTSSGSLFSATRYKSHADAGLARVATSRVLRQGLSEVSSEPTQVNILHELIKLCPSSGEANSVDEETADEAATTLMNPHQLQVVLIEISHLLTTLGQAAASSLVDLVPALKECLSHSDHGVRHEAAIACAAMAAPFPSEGRKLFRSSVDEIQLHHAELVTLACMGSDSSGAQGDGGPNRKRRFRRSAGKSNPDGDKSLPHQYAIHGHALMISVLLREFPRLPGGLSTDLLSTGVSVAEILVSCQYSDIMTKVNASAACTCVRAGYGIIAGAFNTGATGMAPHLAQIFGLWQKSAKSATEGGMNFTTDHDLICLDAALSSVVVFLKNCSELMMAVPDALSQTSLILEETLPLFLYTGRLGSTPLNPAAASRLSSAKASVMEAFAWLPPGSFPLIANTLFAFAARHIQSGTEEEVTCSILPTLLNNEDKLLDAKTFCRAQRVGQVGGAREVEENLVVLTSEAAHHGERESVLHFFHHDNESGDEIREFQGSPILGVFAAEQQRNIPTPLHEVGTWREPSSPSGCSKVRLVDAAIQAFAATFSMNDGKEQQRAMDMLESLVPPFLAQLARAIGVNTALTEPERRSKSKQESAAVANITAVLLACIQALPVYEATHNVPIGLGPRWMNKAKDLLLTLLPSASNLVRRAAAEGLALLATLGVSEDAHTLQSAVLHSLDEVMQGNQPDGKPRPIPLEPVSAARAGSLLTLACIQRTAHNIKMKQNARKRGVPTSENGTGEALDDALPTVQMMTRILPSIGVLLRESFVVKTYALHSFVILISYSAPLDAASLSAEVIQLLRKSIEAVEANFLSSWTVASADRDQGQEGEKLAAEAAFLSVLLRMMTFLLPALPRFKDSDPNIAFRFSRMATSIAESCSSHPTVISEAIAFFERLSSFQDLLPPASPKLIHTENSPFSCGPILLRAINPDHPTVHGQMIWTKAGCWSSPITTRAAVLCVRLLCEAQVLFTDAEDSKFPPFLLALLEETCGSHCYGSATLYREIAAPREVERASLKHDAIERQIVSALDCCLIQESFATDTVSSRRLLHWLLLDRYLLSGSLEDAEDEGDSDPYTRANVIRTANLQASADARIVLDHGSPSRWQVKCQITRNGCMALDQLIMMRRRVGRSTKEAPDFNPTRANESCIQSCREIKKKKPNGDGTVPSSYLVFHLAEILSAACGASIATLDQSELFLLQESGIRVLASLVTATGDISDPDQPDVSILEQFASQIFSSVKQALGASDETDGEPAFHLFMAGCDALQTLAERGLFIDSMSLKRLARPVIPPTTEIPFHPYPEEILNSPFRPNDDESFDKDRSSLLPRIGKLWTVAKLKFFFDEGILAESVASPVVDIIDKSTSGIAVHSAALAIDGVRLLRGNGLSLCGSPTGSFQSEDEAKVDDTLSVSCEAGLTFANVTDLDANTKVAMVHSWPACASNALSCLVRLSTAEGVDEDMVKASGVWMEKLVPVLFVGLHDSLTYLSAEGSKSPTKNAHLWSRGLVANDIATSCLHGIRELLKASSNGLSDIPGREELGLVVDELSQLVLSPILNADEDKPAKKSDGEELNDEEEKTETKEEEVKEAESPPSKTAVDSRELVFEACFFYEDVAGCKDLEQDDLNSIVRAVLTPLDAVQQGRLTLDNDVLAHVVASCLRAVSKLLDGPAGDDDLVKAMLHLSLDLLSSSASTPDEVTKAASTLLIKCMGHESTPPSEQRLIAKNMAAEGNWGAWAVICGKLEDGSGMRHSLNGVRSAMEDLQDYQRHAAALAAVRSLVQGAPIDSKLVGCVMHGVGAQALFLFRCYGTLSGISVKEIEARRTLVCADAMKIVMLGFQHLTSAAEANDDEVSAFLSVVFEALVSVILFNGLPNHPSRTPSGADPALGRMSAQATMHIVRTSPLLFKACMASMSEQGRAIMEMSVRAEMSGYAAPEVQAPEKKKLSLKGFKK